MNSDIFIPARLESKRLPRKHLKEIDGTPIIKYLIDRLRKAKKVRKIVVCTTTLKSDDPLVKFCEDEKLCYFRGNSNDILDRFLNAAEYYGTEVIIDVEGDKIYTDPTYVDKIIEAMENSDVDYVEGYVSNTDFHHDVHGIIPAGIRTTIIQKICKLKRTSDTSTGYREFFNTTKFVKCKYLRLDPKLKFPKNIRLTLDYEEDFQLAKEVIRNLGNNFNLKDILELFYKKPDLIKITKPVLKRWEKNYKDNLMDFSLNEEN